MYAMIGWKILGGIALALGAIGLVLPVWPTTIFWIVAALAFAKSNPALADWIYNRPGVGPPIRDFVETGHLSRATKIAALTGMSLAAAIIAVTLWRRPLIMAAGWSLIAVGAVYVLTRKSGQA